MVLESPLKNIPLAEQVKEKVIEKIKDGTFPVGSQLPPENELANRFKVSRSTIRKAMSTLSAKGLIVQKHGVGTFVSNLSRIENPLNEAVEFNNLISRFGHVPAVLFPKSGLVRPEKDITEALHLRPGDEVFQSYKIFTADEDPVIYVVNSIPVKLIPLDKIDTVVSNPETTEPLYDFFEECCHQRIEYHVSNLKATVAADVDFPGMPLDDCDPLLLIEEVAFNADEMPLWHSREYFPQTGQIDFNVIRIRGK